MKNPSPPPADSSDGIACLSGFNEKAGRPRRSPKRERGLFEKPPESGVWWIRYKDEHRRERREKAGTKALARALYIKRKAEARERHLFPPPPPDPRTTVRAMIDDVLARMKGQMRSYREYERAGDIWKEEFGDKLLREVTPGDIERWRAKQTDLAVASINRHLAFLKRAFNLAIADGLTAVNPVRAVKMEKENNARTRFLSREEEKKLREAMDPVDWLAVAVALATGMRQSEQFGLRWEHVDEPNALLIIPRSKHGERRTIPLSPGGLAILVDLRQRAKGSEWVFPSETGATPINAPNWMSRVWRPALLDSELEDFHWHDLRHTFASRLVMSGVDLRTVQELLGHKTLAMTQRYSHLAPSHVREAVSRLDAFTHVPA